MCHFFAKTSYTPHVILYNASNQKEQKSSFLENFGKINSCKTYKMCMGKYSKITQIEHHKHTTNRTEQTATTEVAHKFGGCYTLNIIVHTHTHKDQLTHAHKHTCL